MFLFSKINLYCLFFFLALIFFTLLGWRNLDTDFGWHYQMGKIITQSGIPQSDPFTYTMPSYPFVDYEWGSNIFIYFVYDHLGKFILAFLYALFAVLSISILVPSKPRTLRLFVFLIGISVLTPFVGIRPQVAGWLLFSILIRFLTNKLLYNRFRFAFPALMLFWVNIHGSYPIALIIFAAFKTGEFVQNRKIVYKDILVWLLGFVMLFINPYGIENLVEVVKQIAQTSLFRRTISEWQPFYTFGDLGFLFLLSTSSIFIWRYRKNIPLSFLFCFLLTAFMSITSVRHAALFTLSTIPTLVFTFSLFLKEARKTFQGSRRVDLLLRMLTVIALVILVGDFGIAFKNGYSENTKFPTKAITYMKSHTFSGNLFNSYNWGGYLIWKRPEVKNFVDGRMSGFLWNAPQNESNSAFLDYLSIMGDKSGWEKIFEKYNIQYALLPSKEVKNTKGAILLKKILVGWGGEIYVANESLSARLKKMGWTEEYKDEIAVILKKP